MRLEVVSCQLGHVCREAFRVDETEPAVGGDAAVGVAVGLGHRGGEVLGDAVQHQLDRIAAEPAHGEPAALLDQLGDLLGVALPIPPEGPDHGSGELPGRRRGEVRVGDVVVTVGGADHRILPGGDAQPMEQPLGAQQTPSRASGVVSGTFTRSIAPSCRAPIGSPPGRRWIRPFAGSGVSAVMPASSSVRLFTQAAWWSRLIR